MWTQARMNEVREGAYRNLELTELDGAEFIGIAIEGLIFRNIESDGYFVVKVIAKKEGFDADEAMAEFQERELKAIQRKREAEEKKAKAKAKKEEKEKE